ncbi:uncharacterized protein K02A2.6-like [Scomber scombrus]|uniref:uncharacterized protein K02A2.6-like n=1 Tax=Scomber scombrus TaxID=13677 RepID=UPI002DD8377E|nr:uncharacterized protein K02A2.6-like [Scomber scombrus]
MAAAMVGSTAPFDCQTQSWEEYCEVLHHFFEANEIDDASRQKAILLSSVGSQTYSLMRNLVSPAKPGDKTFDELVKLLKEHFNPKPSEIVQRFKFNSRNRKNGETVMEYVAVLRKLSQDCNYGDKLSEMIRDRLVCGIGDDRIQRRLLSEPDLTFDKALKLAQAIETASKDVKDLHSLEFAPPHLRAPQTVHKMSAKQTPSRQQHQHKVCYRCGGEQHRAGDCRFIKETCHKCGKVGHIQKVCRFKGPASNSKARGGGVHSGKQGRTQGANYVRQGKDEKDGVDTDEVMFTLYKIDELDVPAEEPFVETLSVNETDTQFEMDSGCGVTVINHLVFKTLGGKEAPKLRPCRVRLRTYTGHRVKVLGAAVVKVQHKGLVQDLPVVVVAGSGPSLVGRYWIRRLGLQWRSEPQVHHIQEETSEEVQGRPESQIHHLGEVTLEEVLGEYGEVFKDELGRFKGPPAKIYVDKEAAPRFFKARPVPYAMRGRVEEELNRLLTQGIIEPVKHAEWAAPVVPVLKPDDTARLCGDYKLTVNQISKLEQYPIPRIEDLFATLSGGQKFTKLDLSHAYHQIPLEEEAKKYVTINTHKGLFTYRVLPFGVSSSPAIFQRTMEGLLQGIPRVTIFLDDILLTGKDDQEHLQTLAMVLKRLQEAGLRLKRAKCLFMNEEVMFLGHKVDATGLHPVHEKVRAIKEAPTPSNVTELKAYLGLLNYYNKFLPNLSTVLAPVHKLLQKETKWQWGEAQQAAFERSKEMMQSAEVLVHYDPEKDIVLSCDASPYGVGAVLSHHMPDGTERPIGFTSRTLNAAEKNYSQLDKEGLAVMFGIKRFHKYIYGRKFTIVTDHKPLLSLFSEMRAVPQMASPRIQRWAVTLRAYEYTIVYKEGKYHCNADALSRLPLPEEPEVERLEERVLMLESSDITLVTADQVKAWTDKDPVLLRVREMVQNGWSAKLKGEEFAPYEVRKHELSIQNGCVLWGWRVIVPKPGRENVMRQLHQCHPGVSRMKALARSYVWWPKLDKELEDMVKGCTTCQEHRNIPAPAPLHPWEWPDKPWSRLHVDYAGPFMEKMFFVLIDAHSKWMDVYPVNSATSATTIECLRTSFSNHGLPELLVCDNGTCFTSTEFKDFLSKNGIRHVTSAPYHAASNGLAERGVQTFKRMMKKCPEGTLTAKVARVLFSYRVTPHTTTGLSPAELLLGRKLRCTLDSIHPDLSRKVKERQERQINDHNKRAKERWFKTGDSVLTQNFSLGPKWIPGIIESVTGPVSYKVMLGDGRVVRRHVDQIHTRHQRPQECNNNQQAAASQLSQANEKNEAWLEAEQVVLRGDKLEEPAATEAVESSETEQKTLTNTTPVRRQSRRETKLPSYLKDFQLH